MLLEVNKVKDNFFLYDNLKSKSFFVFNIKTIQENNYINKFFCGKVLYIKQIQNLFAEKLFTQLFAGNIFFCFVDSKIFLDELL